MDIIFKYQNLKGVEIHDTNIKPELPVQVILGAAEFAKIKKNLAPRVASQENQYRKSHQLPGTKCPLELRKP